MPKLEHLIDGAFSSVASECFLSFPVLADVGLSVHLLTFFQDISRSFGFQFLMRNDMSEVVL